MPLSPESDQRIRTRFDELIEEGTDLLSQLDEHSIEHYSQYEELIVKYSELIRFILGDSDASKEYQKLIKEIESLGQILGSPTWYLTAKRVSKSVAILRGLRDNYENGFLDRLRDHVFAEISADYIRQAETLLHDSPSEQVQMAVTAVMCGVALEINLREICNRQSPPIDTLKANGQPKRLNALIDDLQNAKLYNPMKGDLLRSWAKTRNHAGHGEFTEFNHQDVEAMLAGVKNFLADHT